MAKNQNAIPAAQAVVAQAPVALVLGSKAPKHRVGHNANAWAAILPVLPATAATLAALPAVQVCGGAKGNGLLFVAYAVRRGWLAAQATA